MLNAQNTEIAKAISTAYCNTGNELCKASLLARLMRLFDDQTFANFLSTLSSKAYLTAGFQDLGYRDIPTGGTAHGFKFIYTDVITGQQGSQTKVFPSSQIDPLFTAKNFQAILDLLEPNLIYVKQYSDGLILFKNNNYGYDIAFTTNPVIGGGEGGGIVINDIKQNETNSGIENPPATIPVKAVKGIDFNSYIVPALLVLGAYFFLGKK